jgi:hypothetical protein
LKDTPNNYKLITTFLDVLYHRGNVIEQLSMQYNPIHRNNFCKCDSILGTSSVLLFRILDGKISERLSSKLSADLTICTVKSLYNKYKLLSVLLRPQTDV